jgi:adenosylcobinamide-GDP ribazoletransferase
VRFDPAGEARLLVAAIQFLTRIPTPAILYRPDWLPRAAKYFPLVGWLVGAAAVLALAAARHLWAAPIPEILALATAIAVTGALHEDGLADTADSLGGATRERRLAIMKDSRIGTFGALALTLGVGLRVAALCALPPVAAAAALVAAPAGGRLAAVLTMAAAPYAGDRAASRIAHAADRPRGGEVALAALFGLAPLALLPDGRAALALCFGAAAALVLAIRVGRGLGGYTGDLLGAVIIVYETAFLLGAARVVA